MEDVVERSISVSGWCPWCEKPRVDGALSWRNDTDVCALFLLFLMAAFTGPSRSAE